MLRESVGEYASNIIGPRVHAMDDAAKMDPEIVKSLFEQVSLRISGLETNRRGTWG